MEASGGYVHVGTTTSGKSMDTPLLRVCFPRKASRRDSVVGVQPTPPRRTFSAPTAALSALVLSEKSLRVSWCAGSWRRNTLYLVQPAPVAHEGELLPSLCFSYDILQVLLGNRVTVFFPTSKVYMYVCTSMCVSQGVVVYRRYEYKYKRQTNHRLQL